ncbi:AraC family transcriptional regulator [Sinorhizobium sp. BG8]|uniref:helix-turn-helix domain-containing protein n=1 Tax=Sinorhizobium sp. BG8 TaxID=2613773 RepID=UPI00193D5AEA|nr:AraC family transcriptional regulator [Sinorhizobium sp. BG8]QRM56539.1 helix-turn-helix transcriptional regulator [Sinorhizobium sp. BG8]
MTFQPRMQNRIEGFSVIGDLRRRNWNGVVADLWDVECAPGAGGYYVAQDPRLVVVLDMKGGRNGKVSFAPSRNGTTVEQRRHTLSYIPAGMELWAELRDVEYIRHLDLHFNIEALGRRLMEDLDPVRLSDPRLMFQDPRFLALAELIAAECDNPDPLHNLYGDGLTVALFVDLMRVPLARSRKRSQLASWQLRRATDFIEANCLRGIRLEELSQLTGLSQSYFSHAFKASTGVAPHQWQMNLRIEKAKQLLLETDVPLTIVASDTGFSDQAHFTRTFRRVVGATPSNWKKSRRT